MATGKYDAIIIGSGIGGLTTGAFLARSGMRVLVLEQHSKIGGYAHSFNRGVYRFESGIHSVPIADGGVIDHMLRTLGVRDRISVLPLPSTYRFITPSSGYTLPERPGDILPALTSDFPHERAGLRKFFDNLGQFYDTLARPLLDFEHDYQDEDVAYVSQFHSRSFADHLSRFITDKRLREIFFAMWPYAGMCAGNAPTVYYQVMIALHALEGSHTVEGGFSAFADALGYGITSRGGDIITRSRVVAIHARDGRVREIELENGDRFECSICVSNISPYELHGRLIGEPDRKKLWLRRLERLKPSVSSVISYLGLTSDAVDLLPDTITFWFDSLDPNRGCHATLPRTSRDLDHLILLSTNHQNALPTLTLMNLITADASANWKEDEYRVADAMIDKAESLFPGLKSRVGHCEVGSPETFFRYTGNTGGALYGFENDKDIYAEAKLPNKTYLSNLYQTGHWGKPGGGVWNVMHNAYRTAKMIERDKNSASASPHSARVPSTRQLSIRLIYPKFRKFLEGHEELRDIVKRHVVGDYTMPPSLALPIIAASTPERFDVRLTDDNIGQQVDFDEKVDLVAISCFTPQAARAYQIADEFRRRGTRVIIGGIHPSAAPEEAQLHADAVCIGEVEPVWDEVLADFEAGTLQKTYSAHTHAQFDLAKMPQPKRDIFDRNRYKWEAHLVLMTRGCPVRCAGCPIPGKEGTLVRLRPVDHIIEDIQGMPYKEFYVTDDTVMLPGKKYTRFLLELMSRTKGMDINIFLASTMMMLPDPAFYRTLKQGGAASMYTVFGFDEASRRLLSKDVTREEWQRGIDLVRMVEDAGIHFFASFGVGFDDQDQGIFDRILRFTHDAHIDLAEFYINTPFPGTPFGEKVTREGRILHRNYDLWNTGNVVFKPLAFTERELLEGFFHLWRSFYADKEPTKTLRSFSKVNIDTGV